MRSGITTVIIIAILVGVRFFAGSSSNITRFNDTLVETVQTSDQRFVTFNGAIAPYFAGETVDMAAVRSAHATLASGTDESLARIRAIKTPSDDSCQAVRSAAIAYVENSQTLCQRYVDMIGYMEAHNPGSDEHFDHIGSMLTELSERDEVLMEDLQKAQAAMARRHKITLQ